VGDRRVPESKPSPIPADVCDYVTVVVALDSNIVDLVEAACQSSAHVDAMEAMEPPPQFENVPHHQEAEVFACYWLLAMAPAWRATIYTFSDFLYQEVGRAPHASHLLRLAADVLVRELQEPEHRIPGSVKRPEIDMLVALGIKPTDAEHVADAIGLGCQRFLTNDVRLRNKSDLVEDQWQLGLCRPMEFLIEAVRAGAPWTTRAPWPWESIERIGA
jgi:hypothetical protein